MSAAEEPRSFGVEEEYLLLDATTGVPSNRAADLIWATPELDEQTEREYFSSQLETANPVCRIASEADEALTEFRTTVSEKGWARGVVLAGTGLPPVGGDESGTVTPKARYQLIEVEMRDAAKYHYASGTHVHVEIPSADAGVDVLARLARWAPTLVAIGANSPIWCGESTGFASWRHVMGPSWPVAGYPFGFDDGEEYHRCVTQLVETGIVIDTALLPWVARLSEKYPTIELRITDAQLEAREAVSFALIVRALVEKALAEASSDVARPDLAPAVVNGATWRAARNGLGSDLIDPLTSEVLPAFQLVDRMIESVEEELTRFGDLARVESYVKQLKADGGPAARQLAIFEAEGISGLMALYRAGCMIEAAA